MTWVQARAQIITRIRVGTDVNTAGSHFRSVRKANIPIRRQAYGYDESGFEVPIGFKTSASVDIPMTMLQRCYETAQLPAGYSRSAFRRLYPRQEQNRACHVHVVGRILEVSGLVRFDGHVYRAVQ